MATATVNPQIEHDELPIETDRRVYCRVRIAVEKDGVASEVLKVMGEEDAKDAESKGAVIEVSQTFAFDHAHTIDAAQSLFTTQDGTVNVKELCKQLNNAIDTKLANKARGLLLATDDDGNHTFEAVEGDYSLRQYISADSGTRGASQFEKAQALLSKLPADQQRMLLAMLGQNLG